MDVRSADTANLAAKRVELEKVLPVRQKAANTPEEPLTAHAADEASGQSEKPKPPKSLSDESEDERRDERSSADSSPEAEQTGPEAQVEGDSAEHHILDVRV